jgi:myo-inositol 2-dehydrogenase/D-chiro-inositol 1-dehydrogenase
VHESFDDLVLDPQVDAIVLASPSPLHAEQALACIAASKPVLCENHSPQSPPAR